MINQLRILLIEDERDSFMAGLGELDEQGHELDNRASLKDGLDALLNNDYDVMLLDWRLPVDSSNEPFDRQAGEKIIDALITGRCTEWNKDIPFIVITCQNPATARSKYEQMEGCIGTTTKLNLPTFRTFFERALQRALARKRGVIR